MRGYPRNRLTERSESDPVATKAALSRGYRISFEEGGSGSAIVLVPGATMSAADWRDAGYVDRLASDHRVLSVDPLGNGLSDKPHDPDAYRWPAVATDVLAVMDAAAVDRAVMWGFSRGAGLAAVLASEHFDRVAGLVLHGGSPQDMAPGTPPPPHVEALMRGDFRPMWDRYGFSDADRRYDEEVNDAAALGALSAGLGRSGVSIDLGRVVAPALVIEGSDDDPEAAKSVADALGAELHILPGIDHIRSFSRIDLVMPLVLEFLERLRL